MAFIADFNLAEQSGKSLQECKEICDNDSACLAFEFYAFYDASYDYSGWVTGDCNP
jgi:hypothetical protein